MIVNGIVKTVQVTIMRSCDLFGFLAWAWFFGLDLVDSSRPCVRRAEGRREVHACEMNEGIVASTEGAK